MSSDKPFLIGMLSAAAVLISVCVGIVAYNAYAIWKSVETWLEYRDTLKTIDPRMARRLKALDDNEVYLPKNPEDVTTDSEHLKVNKKVAELAKSYNTYNQQVKDRSNRTKQLPEDVVDRKIMSSDHDNYTYGFHETATS